MCFHSHTIANLLQWHVTQKHSYYTQTTTYNLVEYNFVLKRLFIRFVDEYKWIQTVFHRWEWRTQNNTAATVNISYQLLSYSDYYSNTVISETLSSSVFYLVSQYNSIHIHSILLYEHDRHKLKTQMTLLLPLSMWAQLVR